MSNFPELSQSISFSWHYCSFHMLTKNIVMGYANVNVHFNLNISCFRSRRPVLPVHQQHCLCLGHGRYLWGKWSQHVKVALSGVHAFPSTRMSEVHAYLSLHVCPGYTFSEYTYVRSKNISLILVCPGVQPFPQCTYVRVTRIFRLHVCPWYARFPTTRVFGGYMRFPSTRVSVVQAFP